ncbi:unnamed protein product [Aphanomyces euteiches]
MLTCIVLFQQAHEARAQDFGATSVYEPRKDPLLSQVSGDVEGLLQENHRRLTLQQAPPSDPFLLDNRFLGQVVVESHPTFGSASVSIDSGSRFHAATSVGSAGASLLSVVIPTASDATTLINPGDVILINQVELRTVVTVASTSITVDRGIQRALSGGETILVKQALLSAFEDNTPLSLVNSLGMDIRSIDSPSDTLGIHPTARIQHFSSANASATIRVPGTVGVVRGSDLVLTSTDLTGILRPNQYIRLAGGIYVVNPTKSFNSTSFYLDRQFTGPSYTGMPLFIEGLGTAMTLRASGSDLLQAAASVDVAFGQDTNSVSLRLATADNTQQATSLTARLQIAAAGLILLGGANTISTEFDGLNLRSANYLNISAGTDEFSQRGGDIVVKAGDSNVSQAGNGGSIYVRTGSSVSVNSSSGILFMASGRNDNASSGTVELRSGSAGLASGAVTIASGMSTTSDTGNITVKTGVATFGNSGNVIIATSDLTTGTNAGDVILSGGKSVLSQSGSINLSGGDGSIGGTINLRAGTSTSSSNGGKIVVSGGGSSSSSGGDISFSAGSAQSTSSGGNVLLTSGGSASGRRALLQQAPLAL